MKKHGDPRLDPLAVGGMPGVASLGARVTDPGSVVDDGPVNTLLACSVLERQGCQVETATSGEEALALAEHRSFDLVFMDIYMPSLDGMETSRRWRRLERRLARGHASVLVALTANVTEAGREAFLQAGMDDCLAKPYRPGDLVAMVRRWLGTANPSDE